MYGKLRGPHGLSEQVRKILAPTGIRFPDRRNTVYAIHTQNEMSYLIE
jgi:hypothetical protein